VRPDLYLFHAKFVKVGDDFEVRSHGSQREYVEYVTRHWRKTPNADVAEYLNDLRSCRD
jgi:hypothetical protein